uniref:Uncharacterized protein n=1 Tax=Glossina pallidipes TaxID=7398 RepID=A0A1A9ZTX4_GLOPL
MNISSPQSLPPILPMLCIVLIKQILKEDKKHFDRCTGSCVDNHVARCHQPNKNPKQHETGVASIPSHQRIAKSSARRIALRALLLLVTTTIVSFTKTLTLTFNSSKSIGKSDFSNLCSRARRRIVHSLSEYGSLCWGLWLMLLIISFTFFPVDMWSSPESKLFPIKLIVVLTCVKKMGGTDRSNAIIASYILLEDNG